MREFPAGGSPERCHRTLGLGTDTSTTFPRLHHPAPAAVFTALTTKAIYCRRRNNKKESTYISFFTSRILYLPTFPCKCYVWAGGDFASLRQGAQKISHVPILKCHRRDHRRGDEGEVKKLTLPLSLPSNKSPVTITVAAGIFSRCTSHGLNGTYVSICARIRFTN